VRPERRDRARFARTCRPLSAIANPGEDQQVSLRVILARMIEETARHAGHADILRELIDGTTVD
jgi:hypothetical protein